MAEITTATLWDIFKHACRWLVNLNRAGEARKRESINAVRGIVSAARETAVYVRQLNETGRRDHRIERKLSTRWTELGFDLKDLGLNALAKRCQITGKHWSNPEHYDNEFLERADISVERMERLALEILNEIDR